MTDKQLIDFAKRLHPEGADDDVRMWIESVRYIEAKSGLSTSDLLDKLELIHFTANAMRDLPQMDVLSQLTTQVLGPIIMRHALDKVRMILWHIKNLSDPHLPDNLSSALMPEIRNLATEAMALIDNAKI